MSSWLTALDHLVKVICSVQLVDRTRSLDEVLYVVSSWLTVLDHLMKVYVWCPVG